MSHFFAYLDRLRLIRRWGLMRNTVPENDMEHSMQTALIAHGLAVLAKTRYQREIDPERVAMLALYHDVSEVVTGDLPTTVKYKTPGIQDAYRSLESRPADTTLYPSQEVLAAELRKHPVSQALILVKGSHSIGLERLADLL